MMAILNTIANLLRMILVYQKNWNDSNETNTDITNIIISTNLNKKSVNNKSHDSNNNIVCNHNQTINVDIPKNSISTNSLITKILMSTYLPNSIQTYILIPNMSMSTYLQY